MSTQNSWPLEGQISRPLARSPDFRPKDPGLALEEAGGAPRRGRAPNELSD
ncbi:hypothetical protein PspLS_11305 [Pyricularia sp. CBS 133598]|nr:hypothetical protein PspLS_11305 [Pyricularia sp. CBS 133598]